MAEPECIEFAGQETLIGTRLLFSCKQLKSFVLGVEVCEDLWSPVPPSCALALAGATVIANLSASDETIGKAALPPPAYQRAERTAAVCLSLRRRRPRRKHHRYDLCRA